MTLLTIPRKMPVIVTGGAGFIGSHLTRRLLADGACVTILTRHVDSARARDLAAQGATVLRADLAQGEMPDPTQLPTGACLFHLAADTSVAGPGVWAANVDGTRRTLELADRLQSPYLLFASSIEAQGLATDQEPGLTETSPCHPVSEYGRAKLEAETLVSAWGARPGRRAAVVRIGNTYGPGSPWLLQSSLVMLLGRSSLFTVWDSLHHRRFQPIYVDDLVEAVVRIAAARLEGLYNATGTKPVSLEEYLIHVASLLGLREQLKSSLRFSPASVLTTQPVPPDFAYFLMGDQVRCHRTYVNAKLQAEVGDYARWSLPRGLAATLGWYRDCGAFSALLNAVRPKGAQPCTSH